MTSVSNSLLSHSHLYYVIVFYFTSIPTHNYTFNWGGPPCTVTRWVHFAALESKSLRRGISCHRWRFGSQKMIAKWPKGWDAKTNKTNNLVYASFEIFWVNPCIPCPCLSSDQRHLIEGTDLPQHLAYQQASSAHGSGLDASLRYC